MSLGRKWIFFSKICATLIFLTGLCLGSLVLNDENASIYYPLAFFKQQIRSNSLLLAIKSFLALYFLFISYFLVCLPSLLTYGIVYVRFILKIYSSYIQDTLCNIDAPDENPENPLFQLMVKRRLIFLIQKQLELLEYEFNPIAMI